MQIRSGLLGFWPCDLGSVASCSCAVLEWIGLPSVCLLPESAYGSSFGGWMVSEPLVRMRSKGIFLVRKDPAESAFSCVFVNRTRLAGRVGILDFISLKGWYGGLLVGPAITTCEGEAKSDGDIALSNAVQQMRSRPSISGVGVPNPVDSY